MPTTKTQLSLYISQDTLWTSNDPIKLLYAYSIDALFWFWFDFCFTFGLILRPFNTF